MTRDSSAEKIARMIAALESGMAIDTKKKSRFSIGKIENVIDATDFAVAHGATVERSPSELEDLRLPFEETIIAVDMPMVIHQGEIDPNRHDKDWENFTLSNRDLTYMAICMMIDVPDGGKLLNIANLVGFHAPSGLDTTNKYRVMGPTAVFGVPINDDGSPQEEYYEDTHIANLSDLDTPKVDSDLNRRVERLMFKLAMEVINMANCANIEIVEPSRPRAERRRMQRVTKTAITHLMIRSKGYRSNKQRVVQQSDDMIPLHTVRGHVRHYGDCCPGRHEPRGLLFGKISAKVWVPSYAVGNTTAGIREHTYEAQPKEETV